MNHSGITYKVIFSGNTLQGHSPKQVAQGFAKAFKLNDQASVEKLFSGKVLTLKRGLNHDQAQRYSRILQKLGADCCIEREHNAFFRGDDVHDLAYERKKRLRVSYFSHTLDNELSIAPK